MGKFYTRRVTPDGNVAIREATLEEWALWVEESGEEHRQVRRTDLIDGCFVSTVFLGLNMRYDEGPPLLWETMTFGAHGEIQERYSTEEEAIREHAYIVASHP